MTERRLFKPHASAVQTVSCTRDSCFVFEFPADAAFFARDGSTLVLLFEDGASIRLQDFYIVYSREELPSFATDGAEIPGARFLAGLGNPELMPADRAFGPEVWNGCFQVHESAALMDGMDRQDGLGDGPVPDGQFRQSWQSRQAWESWQPLEELHAFAARGREDGEERVNHGIILTADVPGTLDPDIPVRPVHPGDLETPGDTGQSASGSSVLYVSETDLGGGTLPSASGSMHIAAPDGVRQIAIGGITIFAGGHAVLDAHGAPVKIPTGEGCLTAAYDPATGLLNYTYTLTRSAQESGLQGADAFARSLKVTVTDMNGDTASCTISIVIEDDVYTAVSDSASFREGEDLQVTGNVTSEDIPGADGLDRVEWKTNDLASGYVLTRQEEGGCTVSLGEEVIGTLTLGQDGSYCFALAQEADVPQKGLPDLVLGYRAFDKDGDYADSSLTISIAGDNRTPELTITTPAGSDAAIVVDEGSQPEHDDEAHDQKGEGSFTVNLHGEDGTIEVGGFIINIVDGAAQTTESGACLSEYGVTLTNVDASRNASDKWIVHYQYNYDPDSAGQTHGKDNSSTDASLKGAFPIKVTDATGDVTTSTLSVEVHDDVLAASEDSVAVQEGTNSTVSGTVIDNVHAGADGPGRVEWLDVANNEYTLEDNRVLRDGVRVGTLTLEQDGSYSFALDPDYNVPQTGLPDLVLDYRAFDKDGDQADSTLTITIAGDTRTPEVTGTSQGTGEADIVVDEGSQPEHGSAGHGRHGEGSFTVDLKGEDGVIEVGGFIISIVDGAAQTTESGACPSEYGVTLTNVDASRNASDKWIVHYQYNYDPDSAGQTHGKDNSSTDASLKGAFPIKVTDATGDVTTSTLSVEVHDDILLASEDSVAVQEGTNSTVSGTVIDNVHAGADGLDRIEWKTEEVQGGYSLKQEGAGYTVFLEGKVVGTLTLQQDGSYVFALDSGYDVTEQTPELVIEYSAIDGDGDAADAQLTIDIIPDKPVIAVLESPTVSEAFLPGGSENESEENMARTEGKFSVDTFGESSSLIIKGNEQQEYIEIALDDEGNYYGEDIYVHTKYGTLTVTSVEQGTVQYIYELKEAPKEDVDFAQDTLAISVEDATYDKAEANLIINIEDDDYYMVFLDEVLIWEGERWPVSGNVVTNDTPGADGLDYVEWHFHAARYYTVRPLHNNYYSVSLEEECVGLLKLDAEGNYTFWLNPLFDITEQTPVLEIPHIAHDNDGDLRPAPFLIVFVPDHSELAVDVHENQTVSEKNTHEPIEGSFHVMAHEENSILAITSVESNIIFNIVGDNDSDNFDSVRLTEGESLHAAGEAVTDDVPGTDGLDRLDWLDEANSEYALEEDRGLRDGVQADPLQLEQDVSSACLSEQENSFWHTDKGEAVPAMESGAEQASVALFLANEAYAETVTAQTSHADEASALEALWLDDAETGSLLESRTWMEEESAAEALLLAGGHAPATESARMDLPDHAPGAESAGDAAMDGMDDDDVLFTVLDGDIIAGSSAAIDDGSGSDFMVSSLNERSLETLLAENSHNDHSGQQANSVDVLTAGQESLGLVSLTSMGQLAREYGIPLESAASGTRSPDASTWQENESLAYSPHSDADLTLETSPDPASFAGCAEADTQAFILANALA